MYLAIDVGGTKTLLASFEETGGAPVKEVRFATPKTYEEFLEVLKQQLKGFEDVHFSAAGVGMPGTLDRSAGVLVSYGNLGWKNNPVKSDLQTILGCPVFVENDAKVGGLSEALLIKNDFKKVMYITIGTGVGLTLIIDGVIDTTYGDRGGKAVPVMVDNQEVEWESIASGSAIKRQFGKMASEITDGQSWKVIAHNLALGLSKVIEEKQPEAVVIGGGAGKHFERYGELLKEELTTMLPVVPALLPAQHAEEAVIYGCIELIKQNHGPSA